MTALDRAVTLAEMDDVAVPVGEHLHLDVPRILEVALDVDGRVGEVRLALAPRRLERALGLVRAAHDLQPCAAARSTSEYTATVPIPSSRRVRKTRIAISPRFATRTLLKGATTLFSLP